MPYGGENAGVRGGDEVEAKREEKYGDKKRREGGGRTGMKRGCGWMEERESRAEEGVSESHDRHLCSPRLHLTLYEPMKWLNHFTMDVYNAIDPYLFITPVYPSVSFPRLSFRLSRLVSSLLSAESNFSPPRFGLYLPENKFNMCRGTRFPASAPREYTGNFICGLARPAEILYLIV